MKLPVKAPTFFELMERGLNLTDVVNKMIGPEVGGVYEHWDHLRHLTPPSGLTTESWWAGIKLARMSSVRKLALLDKDDQPFRISVTGRMQHVLHFIDREAAGAILGADLVDDETTRKRYLLRSLIEEAMTSSQLEGASTTRSIAKEMLATGRQPRDRSEQMIYNNFAMMQALRGWRDRPLTVDGIFEMHRLIMRDALDDPTQAGRFRTSEDNVIVQDRGDPTITLHVPPPASELPERLQALCEFANAPNDDNFLHPVIRAIAIHFQIGYDHPFCDGNGRTARALFYWSMLRSGYWLTEYLSISSVLKKAPAKYVRSYLYTESDESDLGYFVTHQLSVIQEAVNGLRGYMAKKGRERRQAEALLRPGSPLGAALNHRQRALLLHAVRRPDSVYEIAGHQAEHRISYPTARADLLGLSKLGLLTKHKLGKGFAFYPAKDLAARLELDDGS
ncbi:MAG: Fic family protein [Lysobacter sp.]